MILWQKRGEGVKGWIQLLGEQPLPYYPLTWIYIILIHLPNPAKGDVKKKSHIIKINEVWMKKNLKLWHLFFQNLNICLNKSLYISKYIIFLCIFPLTKINTFPIIYIKTPISLSFRMHLPKYKKAPVLWYKIHPHEALTPTPPCFWFEGSVKKVMQVSRLSSALRASYYACRWLQRNCLFLSVNYV